MATVGLKYQLDIELTQAKKKLQDFKKELGASMKAGTGKGAAKGLEGMAREIENLGKKARKANDDAYVSFDRLVKSAREYTKEIKAASKETRKTSGLGGTLKDIEDLGKKVKKANNDAFVSFDTLTKSAKNHSTEVGKLNKAKEKADREAVKRSDWVNTAIRRLQRETASFDEDIQAEVAATRLKYIEQVQDAQLRSEFYQTNEFKEELDSRLAAFRLFLKQKNSEQNKRNNARAVSNSGRNAQRFFQSQQLVEDFAIGYSLNGVQGAIRGASNNLSFLGSTLTGPTGVAVLLAGLGVTLASTAGLFDDVSDATERATRRQERWAAALDRSAAARERIREFGMSGFDVGQATLDVSQSRSRFLDADEQAANLREGLRVANELQRVATDIFRARAGKAVGIGLGAGAGDNGVDALVARYNELASQAKALGVAGKGGVLGIDTSAVGMTVTGIDALKEKLKESDIAAEAAGESFQEALGKLKQVEAAQDAVDALERLSSGFGDIDASGKVGQGVLADAERLNEQRTKTLEQQILLLRAEESNAGPERQAEIRREILLLLDDAATASFELLETTKKQVAADNDRLNLAEKLADEAGISASLMEESLSIVLQHADAARDLARVEEERLDSIRAARREQRLSFEESVFQARNTIRDQQLSEDQAALSNQANSARDRVRQRQAQLNRFFGGRGGSRMREMVNQRAGEYLNYIDQEEARRNQALQSARDQQLSAANREREGLLSGRAGALSQQAQSAFQARQFDRARELNEMTRSTLQQLAGLQSSQIGQGTAAQSREALARLEATQGLLDQTFGTDEQVTAASRDRALQAYQESLNAATAIERELGIIRGLQNDLNENSDFIQSVTVEKAKSLRDYFEEIANLSDRIGASGILGDIFQDPAVFAQGAQDALASAGAAGGPDLSAGGASVTNLNVGGITLNQPGTSAGALANELDARRKALDIRAGRTTH